MLQLNCSNRNPSQFSLCLFLLQFHSNIYWDVFLKWFTEISLCISFQAKILFILSFLAEWHSWKKKPHTCSWANTLFSLCDLSLTQKLCLQIQLWMSYEDAVQDERDRERNFRLSTVTEKDWHCNSDVSCSIPEVSRTVPSNRNSELLNSVHVSSSVYLFLALCYTLGSGNVG